MTDKIKLNIEAGIAEIILNKPEKRNALCVEMWSNIPGLVTECTERKDVTLIILHGGDAGAFAAGADISEFADAYGSEQQIKDSGSAVATALMALETCPKPIIAAIEGACVGGGVSLAMACDIRIASNSSRFGITPAKLGIVYPAGDTRRLMNAIGPGATKDLLFTGRIVSSVEALRIGLVEQLCEPTQALASAKSYAKQIASNSQWSIRATKAMVAGLQSGWTDTDHDAQTLSHTGFSGDEFKEGYAAFLEKRPANFKYR